jgi:predicted ribosome quality control (RQC) complex YloA/Tae2 family protein
MEVHAKPSQSNTQTARHNPLLNTGMPDTTITAVVEGVANIPSNDATDTFITQRGGKIIKKPVPGSDVHLLTQYLKAMQTGRTLQSTLLLQKKKEMQNVQEMLEKKRTEFTKRMEECREKQEELRAKVRAC